MGTIREGAMNNSDTSPASATARPFSYARPELQAKKHAVFLANTDHLLATVQVLREGGENNLHSHPHQDGFWMVLNGMVRFYGEGDIVIAELGKHEGVVIPRGTKYWFESASDEPLELLQVEAFAKALRNPQDIANDRIDHTPRSDDRAVVHDGRWR
jgi:mannose-6-phosphate isomerase-like protein (cupin superfamily)